MKSIASSLGAIALAALAHVPCCGVNIALLIGGAGAGSAWFSGLTPYRPWFLGFSLVMAALTLFFAFRPHKAHACGECCTSEAIHKKRQAWGKGAAVLVASLSLASVFITPPSHHHDHGHDDHDHEQVASKV